MFGRNETNRTVLTSTSASAPGAYAHKMGVRRSARSAAADTVGRAAAWAGSISRTAHTHRSVAETTCKKEWQNLGRTCVAIGD